MQRFNRTPQARAFATLMPAADKLRRIEKLEANGRSWLTGDAVSRKLLTYEATLKFTRHQLAELLEDSRAKARERVKQWNNQNTK